MEMGTQFFSQLQLGTYYLKHTVFEFFYFYFASAASLYISKKKKKKKISSIAGAVGSTLSDSRERHGIQVRASFVK